MEEFELVEGIFKKPIRVIVDKEADESGLWFVTSPDIKGFCIAKKSQEEARAAIPVVLGFIKQALDAQNP